MAEARLCRGCKLWHDTLLDCKRAARMGQAWDKKPTSTALPVAPERPTQARIVCQECSGKDHEIARLRAKVEELLAANKRNDVVTPVVTTAERVVTNVVTVGSSVVTPPLDVVTNPKPVVTKSSRHKDPEAHKVYLREYAARKRAEKAGKQ